MGKISLQVARGDFFNLRDPANWRRYVIGMVAEVAAVGALFVLALVVVLVDWLIWR